MVANRENMAGQAYTANVTVTEAVPFDPETDADAQGNAKPVDQWAALSTDGADPYNSETWNTIKAADFDADKHGHMKFFCPCCLDQKDDLKRLKKPSSGHFQPVTFDIVNGETGEPVLNKDDEPMSEIRRYYIPPRFTMYSGEHHSCNLGGQQSTLSQTIKDNGGLVLNSAEGSYLVNLNIPAGQKPVWKRPTIGLSESNTFGNAAESPSLKRQIHRSSARPPNVHSTGIKTVQALSKLLDETEFDKGQRASILLRNGQQAITLAAAYQDNPEDMYKHLYEKAKKEAGEDNPNTNHIQIFRFHPNHIYMMGHREKDGSITVDSYPKKALGEDRKDFYLSIKLNFQSEEAFEAFKQAYEETTHKDQRQFLVYTEHAKVSLDQNRKMRQDIKSGIEDHGKLFVQATVFDAAQIMQWQPPSAQYSLDLVQKPDNNKKPPIAEM